MKIVLLFTLLLLGTSLSGWSMGTSLPADSVGDTCTLAIPNSFSPNEDGTNDAFYIEANCPVTKFKMTIYNRWGEIIFKSNDIKKVWYGKFKGADMPMGVYVYTIDCRFQTTEGEDEVSYKGNVTLIR